MANCFYIANSVANHLRVLYKWPTVILVPDSFVVTVGEPLKFPATHHSRQHIQMADGSKNHRSGNMYRYELDRKYIC